MFFQKSTSNESVSKTTPAAASGRSITITVQRQLTVGAVNDSPEQEADAVADKVMGMPEQNFVQRKCADCEKEEKLHRKPISENITPMVQAKGEGNATVTNGVANAIQSSKGGGESLDSNTQSFMSSRFGTDFSGVKIHTDSNAIQLSRNLNAKAFTVGNDVYFNEGQYQPGLSSGKHLLAHELTHVVQQESTNIKSIQRATNISPNQPNEVNDLTQKLFSNRIYGLTISVLNNVKILNGPEAKQGIGKPVLTTSPSANGEFDSKVTSVLPNNLSFDETVLKAGPWSTMRIAKNKIGALFSDRTKYPDAAKCNGASLSNVQATGDPSDKDMFDANKRHENHHVTDHTAEFNKTIVPWDNKLEAAKTAGTLSHGATQVEAENNLYAAMGGDPDQIGDQFAQGLINSNNTFHGTGPGGVVNWTSLVVDADCSNVTAFGHNPG